MKVPAELEATILATPGVTINGAAPLAPTPAIDKIGEREFMQAIIDLARENGWRVYHTYDSRKSYAGFPDLVLVRFYVLWLECKTEAGEPTADQVNWGESLLAAGQDYRLVRPRDWPEIVKTLTEAPNDQRRHDHRSQEVPALRADPGAVPEVDPVPELGEQPKGPDRLRGHARRDRAGH